MDVCLIEKIHWQLTVLAFNNQEWEELKKLDKITDVEIIQEALKRYSEELNKKIKATDYI